jgi:hypothetical protein
MRKTLVVLIACFVQFSGGLMAQSSSKSQATKKESPAPASRAPLSVDQARMIVKEIPSVNVASTISRWKLQEPDLDRLRRWARLLVEDPAATGFQPRWSEFLGQMKTRNLALQTQDVTSLIQMILSVAYEDANQGLEPAREKIAFYQEMQRKTQTNLLEAKRLQGLLRSQRTDPLMSGSLLPVPANQRTLHRCQAVSEPLKLDCREILVSTAPELDDFLSQTERDAATAEIEGRNAASALEKLQQKRIQTLTVLSETAGMMHNTALSVLQGNIR